MNRARSAQTWHLPPGGMVDPGPHGPRSTGGRAPAPVPRASFCSRVPSPARRGSSLGPTSRFSDGRATLLPSAVPTRPSFPQWASLPTRCPPGPAARLLPQLSRFLRRAQRCLCARHSGHGRTMRGPEGQGGRGQGSGSWAQSQVL